jgi:dephospho-CoA kinase|tara:strand:+ start:491 stop:1084 length:594 start_codon:yes stop_codon:yes gene_type:complete
MKPKLIGITGGIGAGKSTVSTICKHLGFKVYNSDQRAKEIVSEDSIIKKKLISFFGNNIYKNGVLDRKFLSDKIFNDKSSLEQINSIIHPAVKKDFNSWVINNSNEKILFKESALLLESGAYKELDKIILIVSDKNLRVSRVLNRDQNRSKKEIESIIDKQIDEVDAIKYADIVIDNNHKKMLLPSVIKEIEKLIVE